MNQGTGENTGRIFIYPMGHKNRQRERGARGRRKGEYRRRNVSVKKRGNRRTKKKRA